MTEGETDAETVRQAVRDSIFPRVRPSLRHRRANEFSSLTARRAGDGTSTQPDAKERKTLVALDYVSVSDEQTLEELATIDRPALVLLAVRVGATRLIDNTIVVPKGMPVPDELSPLIDSERAAFGLSDL